MEFSFQNHNLTVANVDRIGNQCGKIILLVAGTSGFVPSMNVSFIEHKWVFLGLACSEVSQFVNSVSVSSIYSIESLSTL